MLSETVEFSHVSVKMNVHFGVNLVLGNPFCSLCERTFDRLDESAGVCGLAFSGDTCPSAALAWYSTLLEPFPSLAGDGRWY